MATYTWTGSAGSDAWESPGNWAGAAGVPGAGDTVLVSHSGTVTITVSGTADAAQAILADGPAALTLDIAGTLTIGAEIAVAGGTLALTGTGEIVAPRALTLSAGAISTLQPALLAGTLAIVAGNVSLTEDPGTTPLILPTTIGTLTLVSVPSSLAGAGNPPCFAQGTRIATAAGTCRIEELRAGDAVLTADGRAAPVRWIGRRAVDLRRHPRPWDAMPVRVRAHAFAKDAPQRDLILSPDHALAWEGMLIPVRALLNGATIVQEPWPRVTWFHVELDRHDIILAEGLAAESYLDTGNRAAFGNAGPVVQAVPGFAAATVARAIWATHGCAPLVLDGPALVRARAALLNRAEDLGWRRTRDPAPSLLVDGIARPLAHDGEGLCATLPPGARTARLCSRRAVPAQMRADDSDHRLLGLAVTSLVLDGEPAPASRRGAGWHGVEAEWQWTDGDAAIDVTGAGRLGLRLVPLLEYWAVPDARKARAISA